jgi:hypothetical protein
VSCGCSAVNDTTPVGAEPAPSVPRDLSAVGHRDSFAMHRASVRRFREDPRRPVLSLDVLPGGGERGPQDPAK